MDIKVLLKGWTKSRTLPSQMIHERGDLETGPATAPSCLSKSLLADSVDTLVHVLVQSGFKLVDVMLFNLVYS